MTSAGSGVRDDSARRRQERPPLELRRGSSKRADGDGTPPWLDELRKRGDRRASTQVGFPTTKRRGLAVHATSRRSPGPSSSSPSATSTTPRRRRSRSSASATRPPPSWCSSTATSRRAVEARQAAARRDGRQPRRARSRPTRELIERHLGRVRRHRRATRSSRSTPASSATARSSTSPRGATVEQPIHLLFVSTPRRRADRRRTRACWSSPRTTSRRRSSRATSASARACTSPTP